MANVLIFVRCTVLKGCHQNREAQYPSRLVVYATNQDCHVYESSAHQTFYCRSSERCLVTTLFYYRALLFRYLILLEYQPLFCQ